MNLFPSAKGNVRQKITESYNGVSIKAEHEIPHLMLVS